ncbi:4-hydroxythreonine-4-phosphate dehydrogenase PdxA [Haloferula chungangensis]|uniref:4-hydroxythreonine-4-phosphate dehydrogenase PdxA n=1 Tax=Haloferula chungangensis TaxID=1048331 RepID=A0ABW2L472_9BACT
MSAPRILITLGDPAGIGPEVVDKALGSGKLPGGFDFEVIGDRDQGIAGHPNLASAAESWKALQLAGEKLRNEADVVAVVTAPVSKAQLERVGFPFPGQTEYFASLFGCKNYAMCLSGETLTVGLAGIHLPLREVASCLTPESICLVGELLADFVRRRFGSNSKIAVCGLNPHAGEGGKFGDEETRIIQPAIDELERRFPGVFSGPHVPDAIFRDAARGAYQAVLAMYHDQGLIPLKLLDFDTAVNVTLGLPKPRTSPDHGTAFDIAGKGIARPDSMIHAIRLACELA